MQTVLRAEPKLDAHNRQPAKERLKTEPAQGTTPNAEPLIGTDPGPAWHVKGSGDFNGDGHADILWQNDNGSVATWLMDAAGTTPIAAPLIGTNPGPAWHTIGSDDMHFINATSTTGTLAATSQADEFVLTSHVIGLETISSFDLSQDILELSKATSPALPTYRPTVRHRLAAL